MLWIACCQLVNIRHSNKQFKKRDVGNKYFGVRLFQL